MNWFFAYGAMFFILALMIDMGLGAWALGLAALTLAATWFQYKSGTSRTTTE